MMKVSILVRCQNCDFWHSSGCDLGMRRKRTVGKGKIKNGIIEGKYLVCTQFSVFGNQPYKVIA